MKVEFQYSGLKTDQAPISSLTFTREIGELPRRGERVVYCDKDGPLMFEVQNVVHVYKDEDFHESKEGESNYVLVILLLLPRDTQNLFLKTIQK